jgi:hypothetical protein
MNAGFVPVDKQLRCLFPTFSPLETLPANRCWPIKLRMKASWRQVIAGHESAFDARAIPSVAYTARK